MSDTEKPSNPMLSFFSHPMMGIIGLIAGIAGLILSVYFYIEGKEYPQFTYAFNPVKTVLVKADHSSKLLVSYDNKIIAGDVVATQVAFWNQGKRSIKNSNILSAVVLQTENNVPILEATIRRTSRDVAGIELDTKALQEGRVTISWNILERSDGAVIQLIYAGDPGLPVRIDGIIEGQGKLEQHELERRVSGDPMIVFLGPDDHFITAEDLWRILGYILLISGGPGFLIFLLIWRTTVGNPAKYGRRVLYSSGAFIVGLLLVLFVEQTGPPFGF